MLCCWVLIPLLVCSGLQDAQLPGPGEVADFDELTALLHMVGAQARLVTDPVPFLATTQLSTDRSAPAREGVEPASGVGC
jgi:hypothetical protein